MDISSLKTHLGEELYGQVSEKLKDVEGMIARLRPVIDKLF